MATDSKSLAIIEKLGAKINIYLYIFHKMYIKCEVRQAGEHQNFGIPV